MKPTIEPNAVATRRVCHTVTGNVMCGHTVTLEDQIRLSTGLLSRCLFPELMGEEMTI